MAHVLRRLHMRKADDVGIDDNGEEAIAPERVAIGPDLHLPDTDLRIRKSRRRVSGLCEHSRHPRQ